MFVIVIGRIFPVAFVMLVDWQEYPDVAVGEMLTILLWRHSDCRDY
jgi:hypothetical protein